MSSKQQPEGKKQFSCESAMEQHEQSDKDGQAVMTRRAIY